MSAALRTPRRGQIRLTCDESFDTEVEVFDGEWRWVGTLTKIADEYLFTSGDESLSLTYDSLEIAIEQLMIDGGCGRL